MASFLTAQLDYVYFVYGLALVLLGAVSASISRDRGQCLPWGWLAAFGLLHGAAEWLHVIALTESATGWFHGGLTFLAFASFLVLLEFARRAHAAVSTLRIGGWLTVLAAVVPLAAFALRGVHGLDVTARLLVALPAGLWAAGAIASAGRPRPERSFEGSSSLALAGVFMAAYAIAAGVLVSDGPLVPDGWPVRERWLAVTGVPVQVLRTLTAAGAALAIWSHACSLDDQGRVVRKRWRFFWGTALALLLLVASGWVVTEQLGRLHDRDLSDEAEAAAAQVQEHLAIEMQAARDDARTVAHLASRLVLPAGSASPALPSIDVVLDAVAGPGEARVAYLLDREGRTVAASNRSRPDSFVGHRYADRPYFLDARAGRPGQFIGVGRTSNVPG
ncbi:MAG TPA: hypothetical protein PLL32_05485, partial [Anaeromyxobacteraceae bacterium]|nr:hypothetical protein [Anaeromyxobacteraceae bacterium]